MYLQRFVIGAKSEPKLRLLILWSIPRVLAELATLAAVPAERRRVCRQVYREDLPRRMLVHRVDENLQFESSAKSILSRKVEWKSPSPERRSRRWPASFHRKKTRRASLPRHGLPQPEQENKDGQWALGSVNTHPRAQVI